MINTKLNSFVHLHTHTTYSLLDGISHRKDLIAKAKQYGMPGLAVTEHGNLFNQIGFYKDCVAASVKPILGIEAYIAPDSRHNRHYETKKNLEVGDINAYAYHLILLAKNLEGYHNLAKLSTLSWREGFYRRARIDLEILAKYSKGIIALSGCVGSLTSQAIIQGRMDLAQDYINKFRYIFGEDFYLELMSHDMPEDKIVSEALVGFGQKLGIGCVITNDSHFTNQDEALAHEAALCLNTKKTLDDPDRWKFPGCGYWFKTPNEMAGLVTKEGYPEEAYLNSVRIANSIEDYGFTLGKHIIPLFKDDKGLQWDAESSHQKLVMECWEGLNRLGLDTDPIYVERLNMELDTIERKSFSSYFLIISDVVNFIRRHHDMIPPFGRGSSVGALVCYVLGITAMDPFRWKIPFYRFINEGRKDLPDIDTDISQRYRLDVLNYIVGKYGADHVAQIITFQSMLAKKSIDDAGMVLNIPAPVRRAVSKLLGDEVTKDDSIEDLLEENDKARSLMAPHDKWIAVAKSFEGVHRNTSVHAAGIVISNNPIDQYVPLTKDHDGYRATQFDMKDVQDLGLLKLDMLGLRTMDVINDAVKYIAVNHGVTIDPHAIPFDDKKAHELVCSGEFVSVFQYDSEGMRSMAKQLKPVNFELLMALNALYRPGPMKPEVLLDKDGKKIGEGDSIADTYIKRRHGQQDVDQWHPSLKEILSDSFGLPIYQEQISEMSKIIAGFNDTEADEYRAAIGKKDAAKFAIAQGKLIAGGIKNGHTQEWMDWLAGRLAGFARYGWNRGHACTERGALVATCDRGLVPIVEVREGEHVWSVRETTGELFKNRVVKVLDQGVRPVVRVNAGGDSLVCTPDHSHMTAEKLYKDTTQFCSGQLLKHVKYRATSADLDLSMAASAHRNEIPCFMVTTNIEWDDVVQRESIGGGTENTLVSITTEQRSSELNAHLTSCDLSVDKRSAPTPATKELKNTTRIDNNATLIQSFGDGQLGRNAAVNNLNDRSGDVWGNGIDTIAAKPPFAQVSGEGSWGCTESDQLYDGRITVPISMKPLNQLAMDVVRVGLAHAQNAKMFSIPFPDRNGDATIDARNRLDVSSASAAIAETTNVGMVGFEDNIALSAQDVEDHSGIISNWNIPVIYDAAVDSVEDLGRSEHVFDLTMEQDPNFIANGFVVHNCGYSRISYVTAYLEAHYPLEYYAALLNANTGKNDKLAVLLRSIMQKGFEIRPPDINVSGPEFSTDGKVIYMGLYSVRSTGIEALMAILWERERGGPYASYIDFVRRVSQLEPIPTTHPLFKKHKLPEWDYEKSPQLPSTYLIKSVTKTVIDNLVKAGSFKFDENLTNRDKAAIVEIIQKVAKAKKKVAIEDFEFKVMAKAAETITNQEWDKIEISAFERETLNFYVSGHPIATYMKYFGMLHADAPVITPSQVQEMDEEHGCVVIGLLTKKEMKTTKKGDPYLVLHIQDQFSGMSVRVWSPTASAIWPSLQEHGIAVLRGTTEITDFRPGVMEVKVKSVFTVQGGLPVRGFITDTAEKAQAIAKILNLQVSESVNIPGYGVVTNLKQVFNATPTILDPLRGMENFKLLLAA